MLSASSVCIEVIFQGTVEAFLNKSFEYNCMLQVAIFAVHATEIRIVISEIHIYFT